MEEMLFMYRILSLVEKQADERGLSHIVHIKVSIGANTLLLPDSLMTSFNFLKKEPYDQATLEVVIVDGDKIEIELN